MQVFSINLCQEEEYLEERKVFQKVVMNQLQVYGINLMEVLLQMLLLIREN